MPAPTSLTVLVTGATGTQGGGLVRALASASSKGESLPITIHALVRDLDSTASKALLAIWPSIKLFKGDFDDIPSIEAAAQSCTAVFLNVTPSFTDAHAERRHAFNILTAAKQSGTVRRVIYSSVTGAGTHDTFTDFDENSWMGGYFLSKHAIQEAVKSSNFADGWTILQPATFFSNFVAPASRFMYPELAMNPHKIRTAFRPDLLLSYLDSDDIGRFAAHILLSDPSEYHGQLIPLASTNLTISQVADGLNRALEQAGHNDLKVQVEYMEPAEAEKTKAINPLIGAQLHLNVNATVVDVDRVKKYGVELGSFDEFFARNMGRLEAALGL